MSGVRSVRVAGAVAAGCAAAVAVRRGGRAEPAPGAKSVVRWILRHGLARVVFASAARHGDPLARLTLDEGLRADPHACYDRLREHAVAPGRTAVAITRHQLVDEGLRDLRMLSGFPLDALPAPARALSRWSTDPRFAGAADPPSMLVTNGPEHNYYRRIALKAFTPRAIGALRPHIEGIARELLDDLAARPGGATVDVVAQYAEALPVLVIAEILGVPIDMRPQFRAWANDIVAGIDLGVPYRAFRKGELASHRFNTWLLEHLRKLREAPGQDLFSRMIAAADEEDRATGITLDEQGLIANGVLLLLAGFETTVNLIGNAVHVLLQHPDQLKLLQAEPERWPNGVEEVLRYAAPVQNTFRWFTEDTVLHGTRVRRGKFVVLLIGGANRDPAVFDEPHTFDVTRTNAREHLSFGAGPHYCLGAVLARMEGEVGLRMLFERFPDLAAAGPPRRRPTRIIHGFAEIPIRLNQN